MIERSADASALWKQSAQAWIESQGDRGDWSRREILDPALETLLGNVRDLQILDVGCGEGRYARHLAAKGARVSAIDPVPEFIDLAISMDPVSRYFVGRAESIPFPTQTFDLVLSYLTMIDIPDDVAASAEMVRVVKPGGRIIIVTVSNLASTSTGWVKNDKGERLYRTVDRYMEHFSMDLEWKNIKIVNFHRPLSHTIGCFLNDRCVLTGFHEPLPSPDSPDYVNEFRAPNFQILEFRRTA